MFKFTISILCKNCSSYLCRQSEFFSKTLSLAELFATGDEKVIFVFLLAKPNAKYR